VPLINPVTIFDVPEAVVVALVQVKPLSELYLTSYAEITNPPFDAGARQVTVA
jgi:hypothetical protein